MIKKKIEDSDLQKHLAALPDDGCEVFLLHDGQLRLSAISATKLINEMRANHELGLLETYVLGQGYLAGCLLSATVKGNDRVQLNIECGGPIGGVYVESWASGAVRGYLKHNPIPLQKPLESLDLNELYGPGFISISKLIEGDAVPFTGSIMMEHGDLAKDLALYFLQSEQTPSLFILSIHFDRQGRVTGSGGLFLQVMPGCPDSILDLIEETAGHLPSIGTYLSEGNTIGSYVEAQFASHHIEHLADRYIGFSCPCSRNQYAQYLQHLNTQAREDLRTNGPFPLELQCVNCNTHYTFDQEELQTLLADPQGDMK